MIRNEFSSPSPCREGGEKSTDAGSYGGGEGTTAPRFYCGYLNLLLILSSRAEGKKKKDHSYSATHGKGKGEGARF